MKEIDSINEFKHVIKTWKPDLLYVGIYGIYLKFDLGPLALISILFIYIAIVI